MIKLDIKMPYSCLVCPLCIYENIYYKHCAIKRELTVCLTERPENCPLLEGKERKTNAKEETK